METISVTINLDTRPGFMEEVSRENEIGKGARSLDFLTEGIINKRRFFENAGYNVEITAFIDLHQPIPDNIYPKLLPSNGLVNNLVINHHVEYFMNNVEFSPKWNDINFLHSMIMGRGKYLVHFDGDMSGFCNDKSIIQGWIDLLKQGKYDYISYPTRYSPNPDKNTTWDYWWASTRFFICKRETIDYSEIVKCLNNSE